MKLYLTQSVEGLGNQFDLVEVSEAYALSKLLPRQLALVKTPTTDKRFKGLGMDRTSSPSL